MRGLSDETTLALWERAQSLPAARRAVVLAASVGPWAEEAEREAGRLPLGRRDALLLELHRSLGGDVLDATASCPACGETVEFEADATELLRSATAGAPVEPLDAGGVRVEWRPLDTGDLEAAGATGDAGEAERVLLARCVLSAQGPDGPLDPTALPSEARAALAERLAEADPLAEVLVELACPACEESFLADVPVAAFAWASLRAAAATLLREVDTLARAYGWTESDVLALSRERRAAYLRLVREEAG